MSLRRRSFMGLCAGASGLCWAPAFAAAREPDWAKLGRELGPVLQPVRSPLAECAKAGGKGSDALFKAIKNPYYIGDEPGLTQTFGWIDAWTSRPSSHVVVAENAAHVAAAVRFARAQGVRLVVKGGGHSYYGNSNAADSLLVWTKRMQDIAVHDAFVPAGSPAGTAPLQAVSVGTGSIWGRVYNEVIVKRGRYVQGGGCLTVGVGGFTLGGGFGGFSKQFGTGASNLIEAEVVTPDGEVRIVNAHQHPDLFYALRGGGGGTFAIATRLTIRTHDVPKTIGAVELKVTANTDSAWRALVTRIMDHYARVLFNPAWGEQIRFSGGRRLSISMMFQGLTQEEARAAWAPFLAWIAERGADYTLAADPIIVGLPGGKLWDPAFLRTLPGVVLSDDRPDASPDNVFWTGNLGEAGQILNAYQSAWMPQALLKPERRAALVDALIAGSAKWSMTFHFNKGLAGGAPDALARTAETATNPEVLDAFALLICAADADPAWPDIPGHEPKLAEGRDQAARVAAAMVPIRALVPDAGAYMSEADYFQKDWQRAYWGPNYARLLKIKRRYDPTNLLRGHHTVGSEG